VIAVEHLISILFWAFFLSAVTLFCWFGARAERLFAFLLVIAACATFWLNAALGMEGAWRWIFLIDVLILAVAMAFALRLRVHWPIWFAGFQLNAVAAGIVHFFDPIGEIVIYGNTSAFWALPALGAAVVGIISDRRAKHTS
jgi:hypothetical protein